jgi:hypothetical protein
MTGSDATPRPQPAALQGLWTRSLIRWPDGRRDTTSIVRWLQGGRAYMDLRQPSPPPALSPAAGLHQLTMEDCQALARQEGFAGDLTFDGAFFEWVRLIDYQPSQPHADAGALRWKDGVLVETGRDIDYLEHWHRDAAAPAAPAAALSLHCAQTGTNARFLRVGHVFMFARNRAVSPTPGVHLTTCIAGAAGISAARALVDCEISLGVSAAHTSRITASTLPYRIGDPLDQRIAGDSFLLRDRRPDGGMIQRSWQIMHAEGDLDLCAHTPPKTGVF